MNETDWHGAGGPQAGPELQLGGDDIRNPVAMAKFAHLGIHSHAGSSGSSEEAMSKSASKAIDVQLRGSGIPGDFEPENFRTDAANKVAKGQSVEPSSGTVTLAAKAESLFTLIGTLPKG